MRRRVTAFSLIELTIVIGVIAILTALLIMGVSKMARTGKTNATRVDLESAQSFFDEMNAHGGMNVQPIQWLWRNIGYPPPPAPIITAPAVGTASSVNFWKVPNLVYFTPAVPTNDALGALGSIADTDGTGTSILRNGSQAVLNTQLAMRALLTYPSNKAAIAKLPADRLFIPNWVVGTFANSGADGIVETGIDNPPDPVFKVCYALNNCVRFKGATYRCIQENEASGATAPPIPGANGSLAYNNFWQQDDNPTPMLLDAWGNPLIFVPATGLIDVRGNVGTNDTTITVLNNTPAANIAQLTPPPTAPYARTQPPVQSPDNRAFFVSAGPDGILSTGDDNIYSFSK